MLNDRDGIVHHMEGHKSPTITTLLWAEGMKDGRVGISKFLAKFEETGSTGRRIESGRSSKITAEREKLVENPMHSDVQTMVYQLHNLLMSKDNSIALRTILSLIEKQLPSNVCNST